MKYCSRCKHLKHPEYFPKNSTRKDGRGTFCKNCNKIYQKHKYKTDQVYRTKISQKNKELKRHRKESIRKLKDKPCKDCGNRFPHYCMDFDHLGKKLFTIGNHTGNYSLKSIIKEISKCDLVCANCHRIRTYARVTQVD